ncbi:serine hydrolase [Alteromonas sp. 1_MG-2023]|uniref:serine hydrolase domain-containing protein n=1 Tax=Alteromonas sp. 1_MG-2023 TaxID=3062669 RepID=UPI0026E3D6B8|nr:serine hydrolase [Alteromonas sp. 1_MG-2023]MDO6475134.1 serine hydrolase [Alteromonas sp. 1_MG-2023]
MTLQIGVTFLFVILMVTSIRSGCAAAEEWPGEAQRELVKSRQQSFPVNSYVYDTDWFSPLENVAGNNRYPLPRALKDSAQNREAVALAKQHESYALLVWQHGVITLEYYGSGFSRNTLFDTASMHKSVVALLFGTLLDDGLIDSIDDPAEKYLPELQGTKAGSAPVRSMLEMTSGIKTPLFDNPTDNPYTFAYFGNDLHAAFARWPVPLKPYEEFQYANANTQYLGWIIEAVTGKRYAQYLSEKIWQPAGASAAKIWLDKPDGSARMACCLQATAEDWLRTGIILAQGGRINGKQLVSAKWTTQMMAPGTIFPNYGWQVWRGSPHNPARIYGKDIPAVIPAEAPFAADDTIFFDGSGGQRVYVSPSQSMVIVRIGRPSKTWDDSALPNILMTANKNNNG